MLRAVDLVPKSLPKVLKLIWKARDKWFNLGLVLGVDEIALKMLKHRYSDEEACFREMLSTWLKMIDPLPSWEGLLAALREPPVGHALLAEHVRIKQGIPEQPGSSGAADTSESSASLASNVCSKSAGK